jgi:hypothetical protein
MTKAVAHLFVFKVYFDFLHVHSIPPYLGQLRQLESVAILTPAIVLMKQQSKMSPSMAVANLETTYHHGYLRTIQSSSIYSEVGQI